MCGLNNLATISPKIRYYIAFKATTKYTIHKTDTQSYDPFPK